jgi:hypothetical protein
MDTPLSFWFDREGLAFLGRWGLAYVFYLAVLLTPGCAEVRHAVWPALTVAGQVVL